MATGTPMAGSHSGHKDSLAILTLGALGVVYGDIGTSPLYALRECFHGIHGIVLTHDNVLGVLSLIVWSLIFVVTIKYLVFVMRADNKGEGGILALTALAVSRTGQAARASFGTVIALGLFGAALLYGDGVITPAITVLGAVEGLGVAAPQLEPYVIVITTAILIALFAVQSHGTERIGKAFGPIIMVWFLTLAVLGVKGILDEPAVFAALNPWYGMRFLVMNQWHGFIVLGSVFLVVTGGEALYADMGHFGRKPIQVGWFFVALPSLVLQYFGQGALLLTKPEAVENPFYLLAPSWALYPLVGLATMASIIASQAMVTGAFSLTQQAVQLGYFPRIEIKHTSAKEKGQIYVPFVNWALLVGTLSLVFEFRSSSRLAAAYGIAVTLTMVITTLLTYVVMRRRWRWSRWQALPPIVLFFLADMAFFGANSIKVLDGGWFPLLLGGFIFTLMTTWKRGRQILAERLMARAIPLEEFMHNALASMPSRTPGASIFLTATPKGSPSALIQNFVHNRVLHDLVIVLTMVTEDAPHVDPEERLTIEAVGDGFFRIIARFGFMERPDVLRLLTELASHGFDVNLETTTFFLGRETLIATKRPGMAVWREHLFSFMSRNAQRATDYFHIPADRAIEIGTVVEL